MCGGAPRDNRHVSDTGRDSDLCFYFCYCLCALDGAQQALWEHADAGSHALALYCPLCLLVASPYHLLGGELS